MTTDPLLAKARALWEELARARVSFGPVGGFDVVASPDSLMCPRGWVGVVALGGSAIVTAPDDASADAVRAAFGGLSVDAMVDADAVAVARPAPASRRVAAHGHPELADGGRARWLDPGGRVRPECIRDR